MKKIVKLMLAGFVLNLSLLGTAFASVEEDTLEADIKTAIKESVDGKLIYQVNVKTIYGPSDVDIYRSNADTDSLPSASTIKPFIGLALMERIEKGELSYTDDIKNDLDLSLRQSDNDATNRLIEALGGFDQVNSYIKNLTKKDRTKLNRLMLAKGDENTANAKDLSRSIYEIYRNDSEIAKDMAISLSKSTSKRNKLLKNINKSYRTMNKTGELNNIENDLALIETKSNAFIISAMTENNDYMDKYNQILLINKLGSDVTKAYEKYEAAYDAKEKADEAKILNRLDSKEKKLAYAVYKNQTFISAAKILLESDLRAVDEIRSELKTQVKSSEILLEKSKKTLAKFSKEEITNDEDMIVNLVRLIYTNKENNSDINKNLALAFYKNKVAVKAGKTILKESPKTSLNIRRPLLKNIKDSEEIFIKMDKYFDKINEES